MKGSSRIVIAGVAWMLGGCGAAGCPRPATSAAPTTDASETAETEAREPALRGAWRVVELGGQPVVETLVQDPSCYAGRALFTFDGDTLSFSLETACHGNDRHETLCRAELTTEVAWDDSGFRVPMAARARGTVSQFFQAPTAAEARALAPGESVSGQDYEDSCHVGLTPMRWQIAARRGDEIELRNENGDVMRLEREEDPDVDWRALTRAEYERRTQDAR